MNDKRDYEPRDEYERGATELFQAFNRWINAHPDYVRVASDTSATVLWPFLVTHRKNRASARIAEGDRLSVARAMHELYLETAKREGLSVRPETARPFDEISPAAQACDLAFADWHLARMHELDVRRAVEHKRAQDALRFELAAKLLQFVEEIVPRFHK